MVTRGNNVCAHCGAEIEEGQRWVREKVYEPVLDGREPRQELSCWERHLLQSNGGRLVGQTRVSRPNGQPWCRWVVILIAWIGIVAVLTVLLSRPAHERSSDRRDRVDRGVIVALVKICEALSHAK